MKKLRVLIITTCAILCSCNKSNIPKVTITFDAGQGCFETSTMKKYYVTVAKGSLFYEASQEAPIPISLLDSYTFNLWERNGDPISDNFIVDSDITVNAKYLYAEPITITYDLNGGTYKESHQVSLRNPKGSMWSKVAKIDTNSITPPNDLLEFDYWSLSSTNSEYISAEHLFNESVTLYAHYRPIYLKFVSEESYSTVSYSTISSEYPSKIDTSGIMYSKNGTDWIQWTDGSPIIFNNIGDFIYIKNTNNTLSVELSSGTYDYFNFKMTGMISASGNVNSLINFSSISSPCFAGLFSNCTSLLSAPSLPSLSLSPSCYRMMFENCTSLLVAPLLPSLAVPSNAYQRMFRGCLQLEKSPVDLPATSIDFECYRDMFAACNNLKEAPIIYATSTKNRSFYGMFGNCSSLEYIKTYYVGDFKDADDFTNWVKGVKSLGTIYYDGADLTRGDSSIPEYWDITPRRNIKTFLTNCSCEPKSIDYHSGETVDLKLTPNEGYVLPDEIITNAKVYVYNKEVNVFTFLGEDKIIYIRIDAVKI